MSVTMPKIFSGTITTRPRIPELRRATPEEAVKLLSGYADNLQTENDVLRQAIEAVCDKLEAGYSADYALVHLRDALKWG